MSVHHEDMRYDLGGLPDITVRRVEVWECRGCGEVEFGIRRLAGLHVAIAQTLIQKPGILTSAEVRFLRSYMGWSGADFARQMEVTPETVSRWETGRLRMSLMAERLLRLLVATSARSHRKRANARAQIPHTRRATPVRAVLSLSRGAWRVVQGLQGRSHPVARSSRVAEMRPEYDFSGGVRGKYARRYARGRSLTRPRTARPR